MAVPRGVGPAVNLNQLLEDFESYVAAHPDQAERLLATLAGIAFRRGGFLPATEPSSPPGMPPARVQMVPYKERRPEPEGPVRVNIPWDAVDTLMPSRETTREEPDPKRAK